MRCLFRPSLQQHSLYTLVEFLCFSRYKNHLNEEIFVTPPFEKCRTASSVDQDVNCFCFGKIKKPWIILGKQVKKYSRIDEPLYFLDMYQFAFVILFHHIYIQTLTLTKCTLAKLFQETFIPTTWFLRCFYYPIKMAKKL